VGKHDGIRDRAAASRLIRFGNLPEEPSMDPAQPAGLVVQSVVLTIAQCTAVLAVSLLYHRRVAPERQVSPPLYGDVWESAEVTGELGRLGASDGHLRNEGRLQGRAP
jgi:hypothetical protein